MDHEHKTRLADFYRILLEAERAGVQSINYILPSVDDGDLKLLMTRYLRDEGMNCQILISFIKNLGIDPGNKTGDFVEKIRSLKTTGEQIDLLIKGQEWVARQIRKNRDLIDTVSAMLFLEAVKVQHEENVDMMKKLSM